MTKIFLDDERYPVTDDFYICRSYNEFIALIEFLRRLNQPIEFISFDHDLGDNKKTGKDCTNALIEYDMDYKILSNDFSFYVHSQNPVGKENIESLLDNYLRMKEND